MINGDSSPQLPDPTVSLDWAGFQGPIHEIFEFNAKTYPSRVCVVETNKIARLRREWTYKQINEATNILAHHLVQNGIVRGDVVMIYAARSADLVVAIMGVLRAGATFSVLDPSYPPARQQIYLDVSQPRGLINLQRATEEAGVLDLEVRAFIDGNLQLKVEIPALRIDDGGFLFGGVISGVDMLQPQAAMKHVSPGVLIGPDSIPTLSFTSGSEGRPKGVLGRHYSLTYYFPWMAKQFQMDGSSIFTMLSGIAHDPIQRDIFTPLFLGACLKIPSKDDIEHARLAEWMEREEATVTHLTPAMGQILTGTAVVKFAKLKKAFFVGDVLIKRDVYALQQLAQNCSVINMFGTTETQRAVSYYQIPSLNQDPDFLSNKKEVIPAGKGMKNVQLLVVDRENPKRLCNIGETGEIYVRAGGLAESYLGLDDLTAAKFVTNWFVDPQQWAHEDERKSDPWRRFFKGPRDRLYRSGDLGAYNSNGDVECSGRIDSQVKIRGFRIELGEIDSILSSHPLIRENVTLVRRDKDEEPKLTSYYVPALKEWSQWTEETGRPELGDEKTMAGRLKRFKALADECRQLLAKRVPVYAVPTVFVPLMRMPLNPNGKIDKPRLPFPDDSDLEAVARRRPSFNQSGMTPTERVIARIWAKRIPLVRFETLDKDQDFFNIGGHSLIAQQVLSDLKKHFHGLGIRISALSKHPQLKQFASEIDRDLDPVGLRLDANEGMAAEQEDDYFADARGLAKWLPRTFPSGSIDLKGQIKVLLTGPNGFLGTAILSDLLNRTQLRVSVIALVRAKTPELGLERIIDSCKAWGLWQDSFASRIECLTGDLGRPNLGLQAETWKRLTEEVDIIISNGAKVHWTLPYSSLRDANVVSTTETIALCGTGKPKRLVFVSSTSVFNEHYVDASQESLAAGGNGVKEDDDLLASRRGISTGYGQTKWASEFLVRRAGESGLQGVVVRPGYILGSSAGGQTITDDFLIRMLKACIQVKSYPNISNSINAVPVDHVARVAVAGALNPPVAPLGVMHVTPRPERLTFNKYLGALATYGYVVSRTHYEAWRKKVEQYVDSEGGDDFALLPLLDYVMGNLVEDTRAIELDDANTAKALRNDLELTGGESTTRQAVTEDLVGRYIGYLVKMDFLQPPPGSGTPLPQVEISAEQRQALSKISTRGVAA